LASSVTPPKACSDAALLDENALLRQRVATLIQQLDWFKRQVFGEASEKRHDIDPQIQPDLLVGGALSDPPDPCTAGLESIRTVRRRKKQRSADDVNDTGLRFDDSVPRTVIKITPDEWVEGVFEVIGEKVTYRLCQRPGSVELIEYRRQIIKRKEDGKIFGVPPPAAVLERSAADVSLLAGMLVDKFVYHLPLYRQHQRLKDAGVTLSRSTLMNWSRRAIALLEPIYDAQFRAVLRSRVLAIDETPIKSGKKSPGKLQRGVFWPMHGDAGEIVFPYSKGKSKAQLTDLLAEWSGETLLSDGYAAYARYVEARAHLTHAQCWAHTRRTFEKADKAEPEACAEALSIIGALYEQEQLIRDQGLVDQAKLDHRTHHSLPLVKAFWCWCDDQVHRSLEPSNPLSKALAYAMTRTEALQTFLSDPGVAIDTNHLERALRPIPMGRRNWLFCWTELGAKQVGIIQSLLVTCKLQGIKPYEYLVDVLQRIDEHPAKDVAALTPRQWKTRFATDRLTSDLAFYVYNVGK